VCLQKNGGFAPYWPLAHAKFACDCGLSHINCRVAVAASCVQSSQIFASTPREQLFELKNEDAIKKYENLRHMPLKVLSSHLN
jgi:hypothetical protein